MIKRSATDRTAHAHARRARFGTGALILATALVAVSGASSLAAARTLPSPHSARRHLALSKAMPGKNDTITASPAAIKLWFTERVQASGTSLRITGPGAHLVTLGAVTVDTAAKSPAVAAVKETLKPGTYTVAWKTMATDGHPSNGTFAFVVKAVATKAAR